MAMQSTGKSSESSQQGLGCMTLPGYIYIILSLCKIKRIAIKIIRCLQQQSEPHMYIDQCIMLHVQHNYGLYCTFLVCSAFLSLLVYILHLMMKRMSCRKLMKCIAIHTRHTFCRMYTST